MQGKTVRWAVAACSLLGLMAACGKNEVPEPPKATDGEVARSLVVVKDAEGAAQTLIHVYEPVDGAGVPVSELPELTFRWSSVEGARTYSFVTNNEVGELIWRSTVSDTFATLPPKVMAAVTDGMRLKWIVQVRRLSASSDIHRIELLP
jgi:hypothetical protein